LFYGGFFNFFISQNTGSRNTKAEDFLEGRFFGGEVEDEYQHLPQPSRARVANFCRLGRPANSLLCFNTNLYCLVDLTEANFLTADVIYSYLLTSNWCYTSIAPKNDIVLDIILIL